ncbi:lanthionine synthetase LanC family protein [Pedobacter sp. JY14-1]|uniref:lanthionine synthetase LanC family protein n=1 Tax=Pedobacter sp. JY14-1 TaxID=3034151 RepID=UPI0023E3398C|nr:lanthionine synthetase LanC family protein [Pedobacter sp. JY14-1]
MQLYKMHHTNQKILDTILGASLTDEHGRYWRGNKHDHLAIHYDLYGGNAGILFSLITQYRFNKSDFLRHIILSSANWIRQNYDFSLNPVFLTGELGIAYCFNYLETILCTDDYRAFKHRLISSSSEKLKQDKSLPCEYINGLSGSLIALMSLRDSDPDIELDALIIQVFQMLLDRATVLENSVIWDYSNETSEELCGLSHGMSGVGYTLLQLFKITKNESIRALGIHTLLKESRHYNHNLGDWPDYRKGIFNEEHEQSFISILNSGDIQHLNAPVYFNAWCHGGIGIGLSRLKLQTDQTLTMIQTTQDIERCLESCINDINYILTNEQLTTSVCHGIIGNYLLLRQYCINSTTEKVEELLREIEIKISQHIDRISSTEGSFPDPSLDCTLFNGIAGALQVFSTNLEATGSPFDVFLPVVTNTNKGIEIDSLAISSIFLKKTLYFSWTTLSHSQQSHLLNILDLNKIISHDFSSIEASLEEWNCLESYNIDLEILEFKKNYIHLFESKVRRLVSINYFKRKIDSNTTFGYEFNFHLNTHRTKDISEGTYFLECENSQLSVRSCSSAEKLLINFFRTPRGFEESLAYLTNVVEDFHQYTDKQKIQIVENILLSFCARELIYIKKQTA